MYRGSMNEMKREFWGLYYRGLLEQGVNNTVNSLHNTQLCLSVCLYGVEKCILFDCFLSCTIYVHDLQATQQICFRLVHSLNHFKGVT